MPLTTQLRLGNIFTSTEDSIVIPCSTTGTISDTFREAAYEAGITIPSQAIKLNPGEIIFLPQRRTKLSHLKYIALACSVDSNLQGSTYKTILDIGNHLVDELPPDISSIALPLLGTGAGGLLAPFVYLIVAKSIKETLIRAEGTRNENNIRLAIYTNDETLFPILESISLNDDTSSTYHALSGSIQKVAYLGFNKMIADSAGFYFDLAKKKYAEFSEFTAPGEPLSFYTNLLNDYQKETKGFEDYLASCPDKYKPFLTICGQLIAYIDSNAANKLEWNDYEDSRTMAKSGVRQNRWIENLIRFKMHKNSYANLAPSVVNALEYLRSPADNLMMLSQRHRRNVSETLLKSSYQPQNFNAGIFKYFYAQNIKSKNPLNNGALYSRILYTPEVRILWEIKITDQTAPEPNATKDDEEESIEEDVERNGGNASQSIKAVFHSDAVAEEDSLNYELYAKAIVKFLTLKDTKPPLTIGVMAPWGKGKTTLMHFIQKKLKAERKSPTEDLSQTNELQVEEQEVVSNTRQVLNWLNDSIWMYLGQWVWGIKPGKRKGIDYDIKLEYPVIWFNAWKFQKSQQIWAAFAHEIIHQLVLQIPTQLKREEFWLKLNLTRIDKGSIRESIYRHAFKKIFLMAGVVFGVAFLLLAGISEAIKFPNTIISLAVSLFASYASWLAILKKAPDLETSSYLVQPQYKKDMGYLYGVEQDLVNVFRLLVSTEKPAVIFIDDLDRCSPAATAEIVEAINLFISSDHLKCYFIMGQDAQMVAAALDVAYDQIAGKIKDASRQKDSLGWHFMEKFVQLQFNIPGMKQGQKAAFFGSLMARQKGNEQIHESVQQQITVMDDLIRTTPDTSSLFTPETRQLQEALKAQAPKKAAEITEKILDRTAADMDDDPTELNSLVEQLQLYIGDSPRTIKRFVNLYRFYRFIQITGVSSGLLVVDNIVLAKWVILMIRWPQLVRAIQWNASEPFLKNSQPLDKAREIADLFRQTKEVKDWDQVLKENNISLSWLSDPELFDFMATLVNDASIENALIMGVL